MLQFIVIFSLCVMGSLVGFSADLAHRYVARKARHELMTADTGTGSNRGAARAVASSTSTSTSPTTDPVVTFGSILACYGVLALALVCALPAPLALERTVLTFAFLSVGGLIGEIAKSSRTIVPEPDAVDAPATPREPPSRGLSLTLALTLNLALAVLSSGQGLIDIVPPSADRQASTDAQELQPILVIAQRPESAGPGLQL